MNLKRETKSAISTRIIPVGRFQDNFNTDFYHPWLPRPWQRRGATLWLKELTPKGHEIGPSHWNKKEHLQLRGKRTYLYFGLLLYNTSGVATAWILQIVLALAKNAIQEQVFSGVVLEQLTFFRGISLKPHLLVHWTGKSRHTLTCFWKQRKQRAIMFTWEKSPKAF